MEDQAAVSVAQFAFVFLRGELGLGWGLIVAGIIDINSRSIRALPRLRPSFMISKRTGESATE